MWCKDYTKKMWFDLNSDNSYYEDELLTAIDGMIVVNKLEDIQDNLDKYPEDLKTLNTFLKKESARYFAEAKFGSFEEILKLVKGLTLEFQEELMRLSFLSKLERKDSCNCGEKESVREYEKLPFCLKCYKKYKLPNREVIGYWETERPYIPLAYPVLAVNNDGNMLLGEIVFKDGAPVFKNKIREFQWKEISKYAKLPYLNL